MQQQTITCKNCGNHFHGKFCNQCGEKVYGKKDKSVWHIVEEFFHFASHFEGSFFTTLKAVLTKPGQMSLDYCNGIRKKYFKPISFFLLIVVLYLVFPYFKGLNPTLHDQFYNWHGEYVRKTVRAFMIEKHLKETEAVQLYAALSEKISKFLLFILIPVMATVAAIVTRKTRRPFFDHLIFATETNSVFILWCFLIIPFIVRIINIFSDALIGNIDMITLPMMLLVYCNYVYRSFRRFYGLPGLRSGFCTFIFLTVLALFVHYIYSVILFFITMQLLR